MSTDGAKDAEEVVRSFDTAIMEQGDFDLAMEYAHADFTIRESPNLPYRGTYVGRKGLDELLEDVTRYYEFLGDLKMSFRGVSDSLAIGRFEGRARMKQTGEEVDFLVIEWVTVRDGKVADVEPFYYDQKPLLDAARAEGAARA
jgi:ketosteroid isomerase-like protein